MAVNRRIVDALNDVKPVSGLTHDFYRYPARFSPRVARELIERFTGPGQLVFDPFTGGGTALVEAFARGRNAIGTDISSLAAFVAKAKTTLLDEEQLERVTSWAQRVQSAANLQKKVRRHVWWNRRGYQRHIPWRLRKTIEQSLNSLGSLRCDERRFARCALLRTSQWAVDCKLDCPPVERFRGKLLATVLSMADGMRALRQAVGDLRNRTSLLRDPYIENLSAEALVGSWPLGTAKVKLVVTSPPYPGVHVLYHRWQIGSRRETAAPFWIAGCLDGHGGAHYTFGDRKRRDGRYFDRLARVYLAIREVVSDDSTVAQIVGFNRPDEQLPLFLDAMSSAGFEEHPLCTPRDELWRSVPNRKWYTNLQNTNNASSEVLLLHKPRLP